jgi:hypothetical protein
MTHVGGSRRANGDETHRQRLADDTTLYRNGWVGGALDRDEWILALSDR